MIARQMQSAESIVKKDFANLVGKALASDRFDLNDMDILNQLPAVERFAAAYPHMLFPRGKALQLLLARAVNDVASAYAEDGDRTLRRIAAFVRLRYQDGKSVKDIAEEWGIDRTVLSRQLSRRSLQVIAHRFLQLAEHLRWDRDATRTAAKAS